MDETKKQQENLSHSIEHLDKDIQDLDQNIEKLNKRFNFWPTFGRGVLGALGAVIGYTIIIGLIVYILRALAVLPVFGDLFDVLLRNIQR